MVKLFGFMLALAAMVSSANAALLVSYEYDVADSKDASYVLDGITAGESNGAFNKNNDAQRVQVAVNNTSPRTETYKFSTDDPNTISLNSMTFNTGVVSGNRTFSFTPSFKVGGVAVAPALYSIAGSGFGAYTVTFLQPLLVGSSEFEAVISAQATGTTGGTATSTLITLDNVKFNGDFVPEPASMAIFGLLGAGVAARRFRRKK